MAEEEEGLIAAEEMKVWTPIDEAITDLWSNFLSVPVDRNLKKFVTDLKETDKRFPTDLLSNFITSLENWDPTKDPEYKVAKSNLTCLFRKLKEKIKKKVRESRRKAKKREEREALAKKAAAQVATQVATPQEMEENLTRKKIDLGKNYASYIVKKEKKDEENNIIREMKKIAATNKNMENQLRGMGI